MVLNFLWVKTELLGKGSYKKISSLLLTIVNKLFKKILTSIS